MSWQLYYECVQAFLERDDKKCFLSAMQCIHSEIGRNEALFLKFAIQSVNDAIVDGMRSQQPTILRLLTLCRPRGENTNDIFVDCCLAATEEKTLDRLLLELILGRVSREEVLALARTNIEICQVNFYDGCRLQMEPLRLLEGNELLRLCLKGNAKCLESFLALSRLPEAPYGMSLEIDSKPTTNGDGLDGEYAKIAAFIQWVMQSQRLKGTNLPWDSVVKAREFIKSIPKSHVAGGVLLSYLGQLAYQQNQRGDAESCLRSSSDRLVQHAMIGTDHWFYYLTQYQLAQVLRDTGRFEDAIPIFQKCITGLRDDDQHQLEYATSLSGLAGVLRMSGGDLSHCEALLKEALGIYTEICGDSTPLTATTHSNLGWVYLDAGSPEQAEKSFRNASKIFSTIGNTNPSSLLNGLGGAILNQKRFGEAEGIMRDALSQDESNGDKLGIAFSCHNLGACLLYAGRTEEARLFLNRASELRMEVLGVDSVLNKETELLLILCSDSESDPKLNILLTGNTSARLLGFLNQLAVALYKRGRYSSALRILNLTIDQKRSDEATRSQQLALRASIHSSLNNWSDALRDLKEAQPIIAKIAGSSSESYFECALAIGVALRNTGEEEMAKSIYEKVRETARKEFGENHRLVAAALSNLGILDPSTSVNIEFLERCERESRKAFGASSLEYAGALNNLALARIHQGKFVDAKTLLLDSIKIIESKGERHKLLFPKSNLVDVYERTGDHGAALRQLEELMLEEQRLVAMATVTGTETQQSELFVYIRTNLDRMLSLVDRHFRHSNEAIRQAYQAVISRKALLLRIEIARRDAAIKSKRQDIVRLLDEQGEIRSRLSRYSSEIMDAVAVQELEQRVEKIDAQIATLTSEESLALDAPSVSDVENALPKGTILVDYIRLQTPLHAPGKFAKVIKNIYGKYFAFVLGSRANEIDFINLGLAGPIDDLVKCLRLNIESARGSSRDFATEKPISTLLLSEFNENSMQLRSRLLDKLTFPVSCERLIISPDSQLTLVPFAALRNKKDNGYLIDDYNISYVNSGGDIVPREQATRSVKTLCIVVASPNYDKLAITNGGRSDRSPKWMNKTYDFSELPGAKAEGEFVSAYLKKFFGVNAIEYLWGDDATKERVLLADSPFILHIASHAFFADDFRASILWQSFQSLDSESKEKLLKSRNADWSLGDGHGDDVPLNPMLRGGIALAGANSNPRANGSLMSEEIKSLKLSDTHLVVLSACDTGVGEVVNGEGIKGLRHAFFVAGASALVTSLWRIPDNETCELMKLFYEKLFETGDISLSLQNAQLTIKKEFEHPVYWGAFTLCGATVLHQSSPKTS